MRVALSWLGEYLDVAGRSVEEIDAAFVRAGLEVEAVHRPGADVSGPLVIGRVLSAVELTDFKKPIWYCRVDVGPEHNGDEGSRGIVCGAPNVATAEYVVAALPGAVLPGDFAIAARKTYGHVSDGMICSGRELGISDDHSGILAYSTAELPSGVEPGSDAKPLLGLDDVVFELAITPDRGYCFSVRGLARELSHSLDVPFRDPASLVDAPAATAEPPHPVVVEDPVGCDRFYARAVRGLNPAAPSPLWMKRRLQAAGVRSISLAVDVTNYLMLELGQPMHAFDRSALTGPIVVRRGRPGERLTTLDGADRVIDPEDLLITDDTGPIGLAAVMGGATTEISDDTTDVLIEAAHWDPVSVARTARRHKLPSEASKRFERGVDPEMTAVAAEAAVRLLVEYGGAVADPNVLDVDARRAIEPIRLPVGLPSRVIGVDYSRSTVERRLRDVGCTVTTAGEDELWVLPASWRPDLTDPIDLVEEVARLEGYDNIPSLLPPTPSSSGLTDGQRRRRSVARTLAEAGFVEVLSYPFVSPTVHDAFGLDLDDPRRNAARLANPLSDTEPEMRTSLLPGLLKAAQRNIGRGQRDVSLFELGLVFHPASGAAAAPRLGVDRRPTDEELEALFAAVPAQPRHVAVVLAGDRDPAGWWGPGRAASWADAIEAARTVAAAAGVTLEVRRGELAPWHPGRCASLVVDGHVVGHAGELHPRVVAALELPARTAAMELNLDAFPDSVVPTAPVISPFPPALLDVALVVGESVPSAEVEAALTEGAGPLLESVRLFDVYTGSQVGEGHKSLAFALTFRAPDRTLTVEEATTARDAAVSTAATTCGAALRA
ncbi:phenylalanine--tRNA ligase subunit beta [Cryptosporangium aurantiacum]|uniref:Phenylalanine--tRNA ligase beta subunit n=1 Tax=Cryptosporangium aurantiacum TaxID=134849 RepID=A0A1M7RF38_9ACTN|nr:phenylalanine--tRNA ligase subunit beta [Cryptosporangium aurantiacum]SHN44907.1 phenylalanyl-tRNA synthetase beta subunit [Cryptosporangium aurantiacum]